MLKLSASVPNINKWRIVYLAVELFVPWNVQQNNLSRKPRWIETNQRISTNSKGNKKRQDAPQRIDHTPQKNRTRSKSQESVCRFKWLPSFRDPWLFFVSKRKKRSLYVNRNQQSLVPTDTSASRQQSFFFQKFFHRENINWWNWQIGHLLTWTWRKFETVFKDSGQKMNR